MRTSTKTLVGGLVGLGLGVGGSYWWASDLTDRTEQQDSARVVLHEVEQKKMDLDGSLEECFESNPATEEGRLIFSEYQRAEKAYKIVTDNYTQVKMPEFSGAHPFGFMMGFVGFMFGIRYVRRSFKERAYEREDLGEQP